MKKIRFRSDYHIRYVYLVKGLSGAVQVYDGNYSGWGVKPIPLRQFKGWDTIEYEVDSIDTNPKTGQVSALRMFPDGSRIINGEHWTGWMAVGLCFEVVE